MMKPVDTATPSSAALEDKPEVIRGARHVRTLIKGVVSALGLGFAWLKLSGADFRPIASDINAQLLFHTTMALYILCWINGLNSDTDEQELAYVAAPDKSHTYKGSWIVAATLFSVFALLCLTYTTTLFAYSLLVFHLVNIAAWLYLSKHVMRAEFLKSSEIYLSHGNFAQLEKLRVTYRTYLDGSWQWKRFAAGALAVSAVFILRYAAHRGQTSFQFRGYSFSTEMGIALLFLFYVAVMELWIWRERVSMSAQLRLIDHLQQSYRFCEQ